jgi:hypothetical protein
MVEDINFPERVPAVSATGKVNKVNRKKREEEKPPFEKFLGPEDQKDKKKKKGKKESDQVDIQGKIEKHRPQDSTDSASSNSPAEVEDDSDKKIIDVRV